MFGTLFSDLQQREPLTFIENKNHASALSRNRRDKPHLSCVSCRTRKIRCSGQSPSCDRCSSLLIECRYENRRKRRNLSGSTRKLGDIAMDECNKTSVHDQERDQEQCAGSSGKQTDGQQAETKDREWFSQGLTDLGKCEPLTVDDHSSGRANGGGSHRSASEEDSDWMDMDAFLFNPPASSEINGSMAEEGFDIGHTDGWSASDYEKPTLRGFTSGLSCMDDLVSPGLSQPFCASPFRPPFTSTGESGFGDGPDQQARSQCLDVTESHAEPRHLRTETPSTILAGSWAEGRSQADGRDFASMVSALGLGTRGQAAARATSASEPMQRCSSKAACRCREMTTSLFEELCAESASSHQKSLDALLGHFRGAMSHATTMLDCHVCRPQLESNMLLAMAGHYMGTMLERIVMGYMRLRSETDGSEDMVEGSGGDMWFSTYRIDNKSERMQVLGCLVWVQMLEFSRLLERLKTRAGPRNGPGMLLGEADKKVGAIRAALLSCRSTSQASMR